MAGELVGMSLGMDTRAAAVEAGEADVDSIAVGVAVEALRALFAADWLVGSWRMEAQTVEMRAGGHICALEKSVSLPVVETRSNYGSEVVANLPLSLCLLPFR